MKKQIYKHITAFLPKEHHIPNHSIGRVMFGVIGGMGMLSLVGGFFGYSVDAAMVGQDLVASSPAPKTVIKRSLAVKANAGADQTIILPATSVTLNGTGSTGAISTYTWKQTKGPKKLTLSDSNTSIATLTNLVKGTYTFELKVKNSRSLSSRDTVVITIKDENKTTEKKVNSKLITDKTKSNTETKPVFNYPGTTAENIKNNKAPIANAGVDQTVKLPTNKTKLNAFKSSDSDGFIALINWKQISGPTTVTLAAVETNMEVTTSTLSKGTYIFELSIQDDKGAISTDQVNITVK